MALQIFRDVACASGNAAAFLIYSRLVMSGWTAYAWGSGTGGARFVGTGPASATDLVTADAWFMLYRTIPGVGGPARYISVRCTSPSNWVVQYSTNQLSPGGGTATSADLHTGTQTLFDGAMYPALPVDVSLDTKFHIVIDDATSSFVFLWRRTPLVSGTAASGVFFLDQITPLTWFSDPDPVIACAHYRSQNDVTNQMFPGSYVYGWWRCGQADQSWITYKPNIGFTPDNSTDQSGETVESEFRWCSIAGNRQCVKGTSALFRTIFPGQTPLVSVYADNSRAAFGWITAPNDGTPLTS